MDGLFDWGKRIHQRQKQSLRAANPDSHLFPDFFSPSTSEREKTDDFFIHVVVVVHG